jgi:ABC-2 type transport system permease protein
MRAALVIAAKDLRQRLRDRTAIIVSVIAPFGLAAIFSTLLGGVTDEGLDLRYVVADEDGSQVSAALADGALASLEAAGIAEITPADDRAAAVMAVDGGAADAAVVIPAGFGAAVQSGAATELEVIGSTSAGLATDILRAVATGFTAELEGIRLAVATTATAGGLTDPAVIGELAARAAQTASPIAVEAVDAELQQTIPTTFYAGSMAIFFLFFTAQFGVLSLLAERRQGTLPRLVAAPIGPWAIILGKAIGSFVLGIVAMAVLVVASTVLLGADWGDPIGVALLVVAAVTAAMGITALITTLARTEEQAGGWNSIFAVTFAILGGAFFDLSQGPEILGQVSRITPHAWFLEGLDILAADSSTLANLALPLVVLVVMGVVTGAIGLVRARDLVVRR